MYDIYLSGSGVEPTGNPHGFWPKLASLKVSVLQRFCLEVYILVRNARVLGFYADGAAGTIPELHNAVDVVPAVQTGRHVINQHSPVSEDLLDELLTCQAVSVVG
jgi:hypothetical protein